MLSQEIEADGDDLLAAVAELGLEGIIAKNRHSTYRSGRLGDWVKVKCTQSTCRRKKPPNPTHLPKSFRRWCSEVTAALTTRPNDETEFFA